nr:class I SAM-dependent methyltransferase [uncultured Roseateles sp.]
MKIEHLSRCQVSTPPEIVDLLWALALERRGGKTFPRVLDLGAGDARFARRCEAYESYTGVELDKKKAKSAVLPPGARVQVSDAMKLRDGGYDLCIGNPPYIRHHNLDGEWRAKVLQRFSRQAGVNMKSTANAFVLFLLQALLKTAEDGLVVQLVPFEWVTRPSAKELRDYIDEKGWRVSVYRFNAEIFPSVLTTASITIIDKSSDAGGWEFGEVGRDGTIEPLEHPSGSSSAVLPYENRSAALYGLRGLSPGGQDIFVLTEQQRLHFSLQKRRDVVPCVTTLRHIPVDTKELDGVLFQDHYVAAGKRCWLIRSDQEEVSAELRAYLDHVGERWKKYSTCTERTTWWRYRPHPSPTLLFSSAFVGKTSKVLVNSAGAIAVGSVYGIIATQAKSTAAGTLAKRLRQYDFRQRVVSHSNNLKKVEVKQLNAVLAEIS